MHGDIIDGIYYNTLMLDNVKTKEEAIKNIADYLQNKGYVNDEYVNATINREHIYPTGLATKPIGVAVPHSERENVIQQSVVMTILKEPIKFSKMEDSESQIDVGVMFLLALKGENSHLNYLKNIVNYCKYENKLKKLYSVTSVDEAHKIFISEVLKLG